jgi:hypothetical protein
MIKYELLKENEKVIDKLINAGLISCYVVRDIKLYLKMKSYMAAGMCKTVAAENCEEVFREKGIKKHRIIKIYNDFESEV